MKSSFKKLPGSGAELSVEIDLKEFAGYMDREFARAKGELQVKGFRTGMVPDELARQAIGQKELFDAAAERAVKETLASAAEENKWTIVDRPKVEIKDDPKSFSYVATLALFPDADVTGWKKAAEPHRAELAAKKAALAADPKEVADTIRWIRESRAELAAKTEPAEKGDVVDIMMKSTLGDAPHEDRFVMGEGRFMPGFEEQVMGHAAGEKLAFSLTAPHDYWKEELRGKKIDFEVTLREVFARKIPEADDAFAATLGKFANFAELEKNVAEGIKKEKYQRENESATVAILEDIMKRAAIDVPSVMTERIKAQDANLTDDAAKKKIALHIVIHEIAELEGIQPNDEEVAQGIARHHAGARGAEPIDARKLHDYIYERIQQEKTYAELLGTDRN